MSEYRCVGTLGDNILRLESDRYGLQLWPRAKLRKAKGCSVCRKTIQPKQDAFLPITNGYNRMERICWECGQKLRRAFEVS